MRRFHRDPRQLAAGDDALAEVGVGFEKGCCALPFFSTPLSSLLAHLYMRETDFSRGRDFPRSGTL
jgi:hypothetical protein